MPLVEQEHTISTEQMRSPLFLEGLGCEIFGFMCSVLSIMNYESCNFAQFVINISDSKEKQDKYWHHHMALIKLFAKQLHQNICNINWHCDTATFFLMKIISRSVDSVKQQQGSHPVSCKINWQCNTTKVIQVIHKNNLQYKAILNKYESKWIEN